MERELIGDWRMEECYWRRGFIGGGGLMGQMGLLEQGTCWYGGGGAW